MLVMLVFWFELDLTIFYIHTMVCMFKLTLNNDRKVTPPPFIYGFAQDFIQFECLFVRELSSNPFLQYCFVEIFQNSLQYILHTTMSDGMEEVDIFCIIQWAIADYTKYWKNFSPWQMKIMMSTLHTKLTTRWLRKIASLKMDLNSCQNHNQMDYFFWCQSILIKE